MRAFSSIAILSLSTYNQNYSSVRVVSIPSVIYHLEELGTGCALWKRNFYIIYYLVVNALLEESRHTHLIVQTAHLFGPFAVSNYLDCLFTYPYIVVVRMWV